MAVKWLNIGRKSKVLFFTRHKVLMFVMLIASFLSLLVFRYNEFGIVRFEGLVAYEDIFFENGNLYGIGLCDKYISEQYFEINSKSKIAKGYERKGAEIYPVVLIDDLNGLLDACTYEQLDRIEAYLISFLFNRFNNITTYKINNAYFDESLGDERFSYEVLQKLINEGSGAIDSGVFKLFNNTYLMVDYVYLDNVASDDFDFKKNIAVEKYVFKFIESGSAKEIVERKFSFNSGSYGAYFG